MASIPASMAMAAGIRPGETTPPSPLHHPFHPVVPLLRPLPPSTAAPCLRPRWSKVTRRPAGWGKSKIRLQGHCLVREEDLSGLILSEEARSMMSTMHDFGLERYEGTPFRDHVILNFLVYQDL